MMKPSSDYEFEYEEVILVTPEIAAHWLATHGNAINRKVVNRVEEYVATMAAGRWVTSGEFAISFRKGDGMLLNGHHRLQAVVKHGLAVLFVVRRNVDPAAIKYMDTHAARTSKHIGKMEGIDTSFDDALRIIDNVTADRQRTDRVTILKLEQLRARYKSAVEAVKTHTAGLKYNKRVLRAGVRAALVILAETRTNDAVKFMSKLGPVLNRTAVEPQAIVNLIRWMDNISGSAGSGNQILHLTATLGAFQQFATGAEKEHIKAMNLVRKTASGQWEQRESFASALINELRAR